MISPSFETLLQGAMKTYKENQTFFGVPVARPSEDFISPIGPAAGPHTQLAANCVAAFGAGANHLELKTVQILEGEALGISKPCIDSQFEVYNAEWSTELTVEEALNEYIKAYMLIYVLALEYQLAKPEDIIYYISVGYDLKGIQSDKVNRFISKMMDASDTKEWRQNSLYLKSHINTFSHITLEDIDSMPSNISQTIALSTMHGCDKEEINAIGTYLMAEKGLNTFIKMNPTLLGKETIRGVLDGLGYEHLVVDPHMFEVDMTLEEGVNLITQMQAVAKASGVDFGVKLTNTLPVGNLDNKLEGDSIYLSGPVLFPIAINVAYLIAEAFDGHIRISYSGGADKDNVADIVGTGIYPVTVSSVLLKPGGYKNITRMNKPIQVLGDRPKEIDLIKLKALAESVLDHECYKKRETKVYEPSDSYSLLCGKCHNCIDVCPNRANERVILEDQNYIVHHDDLCNECGNCSPFCIAGHIPYKDKWTIFSEKAYYESSDNEGVCSVDGRYQYRMNQKHKKDLLETMKKLNQLSNY